MKTTAPARQSLIEALRSMVGKCRQCQGTPVWFEQDGTRHECAICRWERDVLLRAEAQMIHTEIRHRDCGHEVKVDQRHTGPWGTFYECDDCGLMGLGTMQIEYVAVKGARP